VTSENCRAVLGFVWLPFVGRSLLSGSTCIPGA
jgi:hypothetical protein